MRIEARIADEHRRHVVSLSTAGASHELSIASKPDGYGSSVNGGELLCLALATCYCNDLHREARRRGIEVVRVEVDAFADFAGEAEAARSLGYRASVAARAPEDDIRALMLHTDRVAEIQATLRRGIDVRFEAAHAHSVP
ncbi:MAG: OsmC family protein [Burkholderiales bacterium]